MLHVCLCYAPSNSYRLACSPRAYDGCALRASDLGATKALDYLATIAMASFVIEKAARLFFFPSCAECFPSASPQKCS